jgi:geranylgeranyl diphosphate synthase type II
MMDIERYLSDAKRAVDQWIDRLLPLETAEPATIHLAMRYSMFAGGKRVRPVLILASGESVGGARDTLLYLGACVEMIHTYSLIHDDLPALDNDDLRRGMATCHRKYGDAMAILAGDALLTRFFELMADLPGVTDPLRVRIIREIACAAGTINGMIGGQVADLESEGKPVGARNLEYIHRSKTGALLTACTRIGGIAASCSERQLQSLTEYGASVGLAFQIIDDILDVTSSREALGKTPGKDLKVQKATYPALYGLEASRTKAHELMDRAIEAISDFGPQGEPLRGLARFVNGRSA